MRCDLLVDQWLQGNNMQPLLSISNTVVTLILQNQLFSGVQSIIEAAVKENECVMLLPYIHSFTKKSNTNIYFFYFT